MRHLNQLYKALRAKNSLTFFDLVNDAFDVADEHLKQYGSRMVGLAVQGSYHDQISNTHSCPHNGITNWGGKHADRPTGYPGFYGRIWMVVPHGTKDLQTHRFPGVDITDVMNQMGLHTGTGGYGEYNSPFIPTHFKHNSPRNGTRAFWKYLYELVDMYSYDCRIYVDDFPSLKIGSALNRQHYSDVKNEVVERSTKDFQQTIKCLEAYTGEYIERQNPATEIFTGLCGSNEDSRYIHPSVPKQDSRA